MTQPSQIDFDTIPPPPRAKAEDANAGDSLAFEEIALAPDSDTSSSPRTARRLNTQIGACLAAVVLIAPFPVGSNRPTFWMIWATVLGLLSAIYFLSMARIDPERPFQIKRVKLIFALGLALPLAGLAQMLPIPGSAIDSLPAELQPSRLTLSMDATRLGILRLFSYGLLFAMTIEIATQPVRVRTLGWVVFCGVIAHALWGLVALTVLGDIALWGQKFAYEGAATGSFINRNSFATFLGMGLSLGLALVMSRSKLHAGATGRARLFSEESLMTSAAWLGLLVIMIAIVATQSRMGIVASLSGGLVVYFVMYAKIHRRPWAALLRSVALAVSVAGILLVVLGQETIERSLFTPGALETRLELYAQVLHMVSERPFQGYGLDSFRVAYEHFHAPPVSPALTWNHAHNSYLTLWVEMGLIAGSLPMLAVFLAAARLIRRILRRSTNFAVPAGALGVITVGALHSLVDFSLEIEANTLLFVFVIALGLGQPRRTQKST